LFAPSDKVMSRKPTEMINENNKGAPSDMSKVSELRFQPSVNLSSQADSFDTFISQTLKDVKSFVRTDANQEWSNFLNLTA